MFWDSTCEFIDISKLTLFTYKCCLNIYHRGVFLICDDYKFNIHELCISFLPGSYRYPMGYENMFIIWKKSPTFGIVKTKNTYKIVFFAIYSAMYVIKRFSSECSTTWTANETICMIQISHSLACLSSTCYFFTTSMTDTLKITTNISSFFTFIYLFIY